MPRTKSDFSKSVIYKLCCKDKEVTDIYVSSTTNIVKRRYLHKYCCKKESDKNYNLYVYRFIRDNGNWENWDLVEVERYSAIDKRDLERRERHWFETLGATLNKYVPIQTNI